jgi:hypothetical protein
MPHPLEFAPARPNGAPLTAEIRAQIRFDACHDDDDFESLKRRAVFSRESAGLYRQWMRAAARADKG